MRCLFCSGTMKDTREDHQFPLSALEDVTVVDAKMRRCQSCDEYEVHYPRMLDLERALALTVAAKQGPLAPSEVRYLRRTVDSEGTELPKVLQVAPDVLARWEAGEAVMTFEQELALRLMAFNHERGPRFPLEKLARFPEGSREPLKLWLKFGPDRRWHVVPPPVKRSGSAPRRRAEGRKRGLHAA